MTLVPFIFLVICVILLGAVTGKPLGYVVCVLATLALVMQVLGPRL
jgi:hypothetical protein